MKQPLNLTLSIWQNQTFDDSLALTNEDGTIVDLTGYSAEMMARFDPTDADPPLIDWGTETGEIAIDGAAGTITFAVTAAATMALPTANELTQWFYDLRIFNTASPVYAERVIQGAMVIYPAVTRPAS